MDVFKNRGYGLRVWVIWFLVMGCLGCPSWAWGDSFPNTDSPPHASPGFHYVFPRDHGTHDQFRIEWWYFTGHVFSQDQKRFGYELTFFRRGMDELRHQKSLSQWAIRHLYLAHFAISEEETKQFHVAEKLSRAGLGKAGAEEGGLHVWIDHWRAKAENPEHQGIHLQAENEHMELDLHLSLLKNPVVHGEQGISRKGALPNQTSHYYSLTRLKTQGTIRLDQRSYEVEGVSWMDHEFGSGELGKDQVGWDWFSLQLHSNVEIMIYQLRQTDGSPDPASSGTVVFPNGQTRHLSLEDIQLSILDHWESPVSQARYPSQWRLRIPFLGLEVDITPIFPNQELVTRESTRVTYWEGAVDVEGMAEGKHTQGVGYVEMTGYATPLTKAY
jgi:predicted secreted hydrolase